ncbi:MAU2 chromatid cohesion factor like [Dissostichus eleginoides]|uniref:MAU2 chromatid cohesion factor like n=1 Tax=Dissostichus eleginoides TaxID=100907 RepID=A0AAD9FEJ5_DISEL|nr:MAU2 chromatid cohesion factor like [Dissostichus eleginoides]
MTKIGCDGWSPEELTSWAHLDPDGPEAPTVTSRAHLLPPVVVSIGRRPSNEDASLAASSKDSTFSHLLLR